MRKCASVVDKSGKRDAGWSLYYSFLSYESVYNKEKNPDFFPKQFVYTYVPLEDKGNYYNTAHRTVEREGGMKACEGMYCVPKLFWNTYYVFCYILSAIFLFYT